MITRETLCNVIKEFYNDIDSFLDDVEEDCVYRFGVFCKINESPGNSDVLILDSETQYFVLWYKLSHVGRCLETNIPDETTLKTFIKNFKECKNKEREE